jgi:anaerobic selenocysteine-containing dehydrogenase
LLLLAVLHMLNRLGKLRPGKLGPMLQGLPDLVALIARFPPERVAAIVGIEAEAIEALATGFGEARSAVWYGRMGTSTQEFGCLSTWLIDVINLVTGNCDRPGGAMFSTPAVDLAGLARRLGEAGKFDRWRSRVGGLPEFNGELPVAAMADEMETPGRGQIRAFLTIAGNPVLSNPNGRRLDKALGRLDFMASIDFFINETTRHASIILPPATVLEGDHYPLLEYSLGVRNAARYAPALFPPGDDVRADHRIMTDLLAGIGRRRGGLHALAPLAAKALAAAVGSGAALDLLLRIGPHRMTLKELKRHPHGIDLGPLQPRLRQVIGTPDRRVHLVPPPLAADLTRLEARLAAGREAGFSLVSRRTLRSMNSWLNNSPRLVKGPDRCTLAMHPRDAAGLGLDAGRQVEITSRIGQIRAVVEVSDAMMPGVVSMPFGWGHDRPGARLSVARERAGVSMNDLTDERRYDHVSGTSVLDGIPVTIRAVRSTDAPR